jgi:prevent-host-death family protein
MSSSTWPGPPSRLETLHPLQVASILVQMTLHKSPPKPEIGIRELHNQLSRYVHHVAQGGEVVVTMRGRRVARLSPVNEGDPLADLRARGLVREPTQPKQPSTGRKQLRSLGPVSDLVAEQRR